MTANIYLVFDFKNMITGWMVLIDFTLANTTLNAIYEVQSFFTLISRKKLSLPIRNSLIILMIWG